MDSYLELFERARQKSVGEIVNELDTLWEGKVPEEIENIAQTFCHSREHCKELKIDYCNVTSSDLWRARYAAYLIYCSSKLESSPAGKRPA